MQKIAVFPGSFDPFTLGHEAIVHRAIKLFDKVIIGIGVNAQKVGFIPVQKRMELIAEMFNNTPQVEVKSFKGLTVEFCKQEGANYILRGLRDGKDFDYERSIAMMNRDISKSIETFFLITDPEYTAINASIVRDIARNGGNIDGFVPKNIAKEIKDILNDQ
ncbi:pantetheine-phosphate adenylyltransferase [Flavobacteriales bacterium]|jgi:pantetheine-phosphate adenylyltransferase|nr:pantetheine-phosphate adenylyltransferase [Flavobacteriales bacterium]